MKTFLFALALLSAVAATGSSYAAPRGELTGDTFKLLDVNRDNKVTEREFVGRKTGEEKNRARKLFRSLDRNKNQSLRNKEFKRQGDQPEAREVNFWPVGR